MYQNIWVERAGNSNFNNPNSSNQSRQDIVHIWDDEKKYFTFPFQQYAYTKDKTGSFVALDGTKLRMINSWTKETTGLYESDVRPDVRTLIDLYHESDRPSTNHTTMFFDIEVSIKDGYPNMEEADKEVISIAYHLKEQKHSTVLILDKTKSIKEINTDKKQIITYKTEAALLSDFLYQINEIKPTILSGWNSDYFDIPYMYKRMVQTLGQRKANSLSPIGIIKPYRNDLGFQIAGISSLDYMRIYKGFTQGERASYALDFISKLELGRGKVTYDGTLEDLYRDDIDRFIEYNLEDVILLRDLDEKLNFIALAQAICHKGHVPYEDIHHTSVYLDGAALTYMKQVGVVAPNRKQNFNFELSDPGEVGDTKLFFNNNVFNIPAVGKLRIYKTKSSIIYATYKKYADNYIVLTEPLKERIKVGYEIHLDLPGAFVQEPIPGLYDWVYDLDLTSLYPSEIMSLNISPETKIGRILDWNSEEWVQKVKRTYTVGIRSKRIKYSETELSTYLNTNNYSVAANGVFYKQDIPGFLPTILNNWFEERAVFKSKRDEFGNKGDREKYDYYDLRQMVMKVLLNSFYGVLALPRFRFYDVDNAEAITLSGQSIIKFTKRTANNYYNKIIGEKYIITLENDTKITLYEMDNVSIKRNNIVQKILVKDLVETDDLLI